MTPMDSFLADIEEDILAGRISDAIADIRLEIEYQEREIVRLRNRIWELGGSA